MRNIWQTSQFLCHDSVGKCFAQFCFMRQSAPVSRASCRGHASLRPSEHATGNEFAVESTGWRPQSQRYGQISLPTSTKKVLVIVIVIVIVIVVVIGIVITDSFWHSFGHFMHSFLFLLFNEFFITDEGNANALQKGSCRLWLPRTRARSSQESTFNANAHAKASVGSHTSFSCVFQASC